MYKILIAGLFWVFSTISQADLITGRVVGVADGDTITLMDSTNTQHKIRLAGIDAPKKKQAFGNVSKKSLSDLVFGKQVTVDLQKDDRYGRTVGKVIVNDVDANLEQIKRGMAWFYIRYQNEQPAPDRLDMRVHRMTHKRIVWVYGTTQIQLLLGISGSRTRIIRQMGTESAMQSFIAYRHQD